MYQTTKESLARFGEKFKDSFEYGAIDTWERAEPVKSFIKSSHIALIESMIERLEVMNGYDYTTEKTIEWISGYNQAIQNQISYLKSELDLINKLD